MKEENSNYHIKPLDGSPLMSDNCWKAVLNAVRSRAKKEKEIRCLEWGSGNSTVSLIRLGRELGMRFHLQSVDHDTRFFPWLAESVLEEARKNGHVVSATWRPVRESSFSVQKAFELMKKHRLWKSSPMSWQILLGNKRIQYAEGIKPYFGFSVLRFARQAAKLFLMMCEYWWWLLVSVLHSLTKSETMYSKESFLRRPAFESHYAGDFAAYFAKHPVPGCLEISDGTLSIELWHIPELSGFFWNRGVVYDGSIYQLPLFVGVPADGTFDLVFVDGRARVSCIKRTHHDKLLKRGGSLFVHDAYRVEMAEGFELFTKTPTILRGSNVMLNGEERCASDFGYPLVKTGEDPKRLEYRIGQELFIFQNQE